MQKEIRALYISYDGMTDPLGESQVIPYLRELSKKGVKISILSAEKSEVFYKRKENIEANLVKYNIVWHPIMYTKKPPILSTLKDIRKLKKAAKKIYHQKPFDIVHCRSYISAFAGVYLKKKFGVKFLFDMRGFYADERVDGNLWPQSNPIFKRVYKYFKKKEKEFFSLADHTISLTYAGRDIIHQMPDLENIPIDVIPCCADMEHFNFNSSSKSSIDRFRNELQITEDDYILSYLGSVGTWYMPDEMMAFFKSLLKIKPEAKFLIITKDNPDVIQSLIEKYNIPEEKIIIRPANREEVPDLLFLSNVSIFFIKPVFSKKASSPTKLAELLGMGIPVVCNSNVGDIDKFVPENNLGIMINSFNDDTYIQACKKLENLEKIKKDHLRNVACELFSLDGGSKTYYKVYKTLIN